MPTKSKQKAEEPALPLAATPRWPEVRRAEPRRSTRPDGQQSCCSGCLRLAASRRFSILETWPPQGDAAFTALLPAFLTLTFMVPSLMGEVRKTSSCILVSGSSTAESQERHRMFPLRGEQSVRISHGVRRQVTSVELTLRRLLSLNCHCRSGCMRARNKQCSHRRHLSLLRAKKKGVKKKDNKPG